jgi:hypothetical protein
MKIKLYSVNIEAFGSNYCYYSEYIKKYNTAVKVNEALNTGFNIELQPEPERDAEGKEKYNSWHPFVSSSDVVMLTEEQVVWLAVNNHTFKVKQEVPVEVADVNKTFEFVAGKSNELTQTNNTYNNRCEVHMPGNMLASYNEVMLIEDSCTDQLQSALSSGWRMIAVCPQPDQRRPDYIMGRWNPNKELDDGAERG